MSNPTKPLKPLPCNRLRNRRLIRSEGQDLPPLDVPMMPVPTVSDIGRRFEAWRRRFHGNREGGGQ